MISFSDTSRKSSRSYPNTQSGVTVHIMMVTSVFLFNVFNIFLLDDEWRICQLSDWEQHQTDTPLSCASSFVIHMDAVSLLLRLWSPLRICNFHRDGKEDIWTHDSHTERTVWMGLEFKTYKLHLSDIKTSLEATYCTQVWCENVKPSAQNDKN